jgi:hypothetical protein
MLDTDAITRQIQQEIKTQVSNQVAVALGSEEWLESFERKVVEFVQARVMVKFGNAEYLPEITETVKSSVNELFKKGIVPGIDQYVDADDIKKTVDVAVKQLVDSSIEFLSADPVWIAKIERQVNQTVVDRITLQLSQIDLNPIIKQRIDENMAAFQQDMLVNFASTGIKDNSTSTQLTVTDDEIVAENQLISRSLKVMNVATIQDLVVKGTVNIDNPSWTQLAEGISDRTLEKLSAEWQDTLVQQVADKIKTSGIDFDTVTIGGTALVEGNTLSGTITDTNIQQTGTLRTLEVAGESIFNNQTLSVLNKRIGVNTVTPEMALSVWDEEVSIVVGKNKANEAYIGTNRAQGVAIGVNRVPQIEINADGVTRVKQLQVGLHRISHDVKVPGWSGTRGDIVFNSNPNDAVFAWVCLGQYQWKTLKSAE